MSKNPQKTLAPPWQARQERQLATFRDALKAHPHWLILPRGQHAPEQAVAVYAADSGRRYPDLARLRAARQSHPFLYLGDAQGNRLATWHTATGLLWCHQAWADQFVLADAARELLKAARWAGLEGWRLPNKDELWAFATAAGNPHRRGQNYRLATANGNESYAWLTAGGRCNVDDGGWSVNSGWSGYIFACHDAWGAWPDWRLLVHLAEANYQLVSPDGQLRLACACDASWADEPLAMLAALYSAGQWLRAADDDRRVLLDPADFFVEAQFSHLDYTPCRLPRLEPAQWLDPHKGLWELWGEDSNFLRRMGWRARDPRQDVRAQFVAIDFGTSSTVVAVESATGQPQLLRIGVRDFYAALEPAHFENPTVLECLDFQAFWQVWSEQAQRPPLNWDHMRAAHEAQASWRDNPGDVAVLARILPRLKQWALRNQESVRVRLVDARGYELELPPHTERNPLRGQPLAVSPDDPFDPIELYAWYLGMAINWRGHGLFLRYVLSFPAKYPAEVKGRILASFRRGLLRSLPQSLLQSAPEVLNTFSVEELASEPAAYAAAALPHLGIEPTPEGVPYAVFDFGGGTTDFDFGLYRLPTDEEAAAGYEQVFVHQATSGDNFLGGENLIEHLVYRTFQDNLEELRAKRIQFTRPLDAAPFHGSEALLAHTRAAQTNTVLLAARLRPFFEGETAPTLGQIKIDLLDDKGQKQACELKVPEEALEAFLNERIGAGVRAFLNELRRLRAHWPAQAPIHVLLAGNASRCRTVRALFFEEPWHQLLAEVFGDDAPAIEVHPPLPMDPQNPHAPTAKTGVALGLLALTPGQGVKIIQAVHDKHAGEAPFGWYVGVMRRNRFTPVLSPDTPYGHWHELGVLHQGHFALYVTLSPRAATGMQRGDPELVLLRRDFPGAAEHARLFACALAPGRLRLAVAMHLEEAARATLSEELNLSSG